MDSLYLIYLFFGFLVLLVLLLAYLVYSKNKELTQTKLQLQDRRENISKLEAFLQSRDAKVEELKELSVEKDDKINSLIQENSELKRDIAAIQTTFNEQKKSLQEKLELLEKSKEKMTKEFEFIAQKILEDNSKKFEERSSLGVKRIIEPVKLQIDEFKKRVDDIYDKESRDRSMLLIEIKHLKELNQKINQEAINLTNALKGESKSQGIWGEMVLERVLESSGLREGYEYEREVALKAEEGGRYRPDVIVKLPANRHIIIDAKTSLSDYERYISSEDEEEKKRYLKAHLNSIKEHIKELSGKEYEKLLGINSLDFIFMFVPIEGALMLALQSDASLYDEAFKKHIVLVSPTTLLVALRAVENSWRYEKQAQNIKEVTKKAEALYSKFVGFVNDFESVGKSLKRAEDSYENAFKKLTTGRGNIVRQLEQFKKLSNISPKQELPKEIVEKN